MLNNKQSLLINIIDKIMKLSYIIDKKKQIKLNGGNIMKKLISSILNIFKKKNEKNIQVNNINSVCESDSRELGGYCEMEGLNK